MLINPGKASVLGWEAWFTVGVIVALLVALVRDVARPDMLLLGSVGVLLVAGILTPEEAFAGFSNPAMLTVAALYVVAAGVQRTEALAALDRVLFQRTARMGPMLARFMLPTAVLSGFLNNTPIVAMLTPRLQEWAQERGISPSKVMIPLSYAAITGGMLTLVGTSTNLIVSGLLQTEGYAPLGLFDVTWVGVPAMACVIGYFMLGGHRLLPDRGESPATVEDELQRGLFELKVAVQSPLIGQSLEEAGLRSIPDAYLVHIRRGDQMIQATPRTVVEQGDVLAFTASATAIRQLLQRPGLKRNAPADGVVDDGQGLPLFEAVVAESSQLVGKTLGEVNFRERYQGVVLGIQRKDEAMQGPIGHTPIRAGDLLFVEADSDFDERWGGSQDEFYLVAPRQDERPAPASWKAPLALAITGAMVLAAATGVVPIVTAAFAAAFLMIITGCLSTAGAQEALNVQVLVVIAAALGLGHAVQATGLARVIADGILSLTAGAGPIAALVAVYVATNLLTELITNNAAAVLMLPVSLSAADSLGVTPEAFAVVVAVAASASFITPIGYQTNLMVMSPGGYRFSDYARVGWPVSLVVMGVTVAVIALLWL